MRERYVREQRGALAAVSFLSRVPVGLAVELNADDVRRAGASFPLVGAALGAAVGAVAFGLAHWLPPLAAAGVALAVSAVLTGALHLDALADSADALGARTRERALEIMRDHAIGAYGAAALTLDLLLRATAIAALAGSAHVVAAAAAAGAASRAAPVALGSCLPYARPGGGVGAPFARTPRGRAATAVAIAILIGIAVDGAEGAAILAVAAAVALAAGLAARRGLGGVTGDVLGAASELAELGGLLVAAALAG